VEPIRILILAPCCISRFCPHEMFSVFPVFVILSQILMHIHCYQTLTYTKITWSVHFSWVPKECNMPEMWIQFGYFLITPLIILCSKFKVTYAKQMWNLHNLTACWVLWWIAGENMKVSSVSTTLVSAASYSFNVYGKMKMVFVLTDET